MDEFDLGPLYSRIGEAAAMAARHEAGSIFVHAEAGDNWCGVSVFTDMGDHLIYRYPHDDLSNLVMRAWNAAPEKKKWHSFTYEIIGDRFEMKFFYADDFDPDDPDIDHRDRLLKERFGDKPVDFSDPEPGA